MLMFCAVCFLRQHLVSDHWRRAARTAASSQESEEEGENTSRSVCDSQMSPPSHRLPLPRVSSGAQTGSVTSLLLLCNMLGLLHLVSLVG